MMAEPFVDPGGLLVHWVETDLVPYVAEGGSCVKWITGRPGSGKSTLLAALRRHAQPLGFLSAAVSAAEVPVGRFDEFYRAIARQLAPEVAAKAVAEGMARDLGRASWFALPGGPTLEDDLIGSGRPAEAVRSDLQAKLYSLHQKPDIIDPVATALRRMVEPFLRGAIVPESDAISRRWLLGEKVSASERRRAGIRVPVDRYGARDIFRSLLAVLRLGGKKGAVITVDDLEALLTKEEPVKYTRMRRDDAYEGIREFIDDLGTLPGLFLVYAGRGEVFTDERAGLRSYPALAMRVTNEVRSRRLNLLNDVQNLDDLWRTDWATNRQMLCEAYGATEAPDLFQSPQVWLQGSVSPVKLLVEAISRREAF